MLPYASRTHAKILDAIEQELPELDDCISTTALRDELDLVKIHLSTPIQLTLPAWRKSVTEIGY